MLLAHNRCDICGDRLGESYLQAGRRMCFSCWDATQSDPFRTVPLFGPISAGGPVSEKPGPAGPELVTEDSVYDAVYEVKRGDNSLGRVPYKECPYCGHILKECGCGFSWTPLGRARQRQGE